MRSQIAAEEAAAAAGSGGLLTRLWGGVEAVAVRVGLRSRRYDGHVRLREEPAAAAAAAGAPPGSTAVQVRRGAREAGRGLQGAPCPSPAQLRPLADVRAASAKAGGGGGGGYEAPVSTGGRAGKAGTGAGAGSVPEGPPRVILEDVSFRIAPGTTTAVCGQTGAGRCAGGAHTRSPPSAQDAPCPHHAALLPSPPLRLHRQVDAGAPALPLLRRVRWLRARGWPGRAARDAPQPAQQHRCGGPLRAAGRRAVGTPTPRPSPLPLPGMVPQDCVLFNETLRYNIECACRGSGADGWAATHSLSSSNISGTAAPGPLTRTSQRPSQLRSSATSSPACRWASTRR